MKVVRQARLELSGGSTPDQLRPSPRKALRHAAPLQNGRDETRPHRLRPGLRDSGVEATDEKSASSDAMPHNRTACDAGRGRAQRCAGPGRSMI